MYKNSAARERVLESLRVRGPSSIQELSMELGVVPVTLRQHLQALEQQGLISSSRDRGAIGRPKHRYALTDAAYRQLADGTARLCTDLLQGLQSLGGQRTVDQLLDLAAARYAQPRASEAATTLRDRVAATAGVLQDESGLAGWEESDSGFLIRDYGCPYLELARERPEICRYHTRVVTRLAGAPTELRQAIRDGAAHCVFRITSGPQAVGVRRLSDGRIGPGHVSASL